MASFISSSSNNNRDLRKLKNYYNKKCCFCDEPLSSKSYDEKVIALTCSHVSHEECLWTLIIGIPKENLDINKLFPTCGICGKTTFPEDVTLRDSLVSKYLLSPKTQEAALPPTIHLKPQTLSSQLLIQEPKFQSLSLHSKNAKDLSIEIPEMKESPRSSSVMHHQKSHKSRGSSISAISSIVSSVPKSPSPKSQVFNADEVSLALLRSEHILFLIQELNKHGIHVKETDIDAMGLLRLVDELSVSVDGTEFKTYIVYLFQYELVLVRTGYAKWLRFPVQHVDVCTPNRATLQLMLQYTGFYIKHGDSFILQKWISALCDLEQHFNVENLSSTIQRKDLLLDFGESSRMTIPVLLSPLKFSPQERQLLVKKDNMLLVINHCLPLPGVAVMTLQNICRVLQTQFLDFQLLCTMDCLKQSYSTEIDGIGKADNVGDSFSDMLESVDTANTAVCIITTEDVSEKLKTSYMIKDHLVICVGAGRGSNNTPSLVYASSWEDIMECLMSNLDIHVGENQLEDDGDMDSINSDFDSDFNSDNNVGLDDNESRVDESPSTSEDNILKQETRNVQAGAAASREWTELFDTIDDVMRYNLKDN